MLEHILSTIICEEYQRNIKDNPGPHNEGIFITFSVDPNNCSLLDGYDGDKHKRYPQIHLLIFGRYNYTGVYVRESVLHPSEETSWKCLSYHDSCWRDAINRFLFENSGNLGTVSTLHCRGYWYDKHILSGELIETLRQVRKERYGY